MSKRTTQFCPKGHNKDVVGRTTDGHCRKCKNLRDADRRKRIKERKHIVVPKSNICVNGHDVTVTGRYENGSCIACRKERHLNLYDPHPYFKQFCLRGHDTFVTGRTETNNCIACIVDYRAEYFQKNKKRINKQYTERRKTDLVYKLKVYLRVRLNRAIKDGAKAGSAVRDLGCSIEFFKNYIAGKFTGDMTWDNWGKVWELDHIVPLFKFDLIDIKQFLKACNYENMQPLTIEDHLKKTAKEAAGWKKGKK